MPESVTKGPRVPWLATALLGWVGLGCSQSAGSPLKSSGASIVYLDAGTDELIDADRDAALVSCTLERATAPSALGCRADWLCPGAGLYTFFCGPLDGATAACYCQTSGGLVVTNSTACATAGGDFTTEAMRACGWSFAFTSRDGGGQ
jgi:hypothetical protein